MIRTFIGLTKTQADASYAAARAAVLDASGYAGYDSTGATDSTAAITAALAAAAVWGVREVRLTGSPQVTGLVAPAAGMKISGGGSKSGTTLQLVGVGPLIATGTDDASAVGASDYTGQDYLTVEGIKLAVLNPTTNLDNGYGTYTPNTVAVQDWRGGNVRLLDVRIFNFDIPFQGPSSDLDDWDNVELNQCHRGLHIQSRSDQFAAANVRAFYCDQALDIDSVNSVIIDKLNLYACGVPMTPTTFTDLATTNANAVITSVTATFAATDVGVAVSGPGIPDQTIILSVSGNTATLSNNATATATGQTLTMYRSGGRAPIVIRSSDTNRPTTNVEFRNPHFESTPGADSSHVKLYESMVEIGIGDTVTTRNVHIHRPDVRTGTISSYENIQYFAKIDNADGVVIDDPSYWGQDMQWMTGLALLVGATGNTAHRSRHRTAMTSQQRNAVRIISRSTASAATQPRWLREVYGYTVTAGIPGPYRGEMVSETGMLRRVTDSVNAAVYDQYYDVVNGIGASLQWGAGNTTGSGTVRWALPFGLHLNDGASNDFLGWTAAQGLNLQGAAIAPYLRTGLYYFTVPTSSTGTSNTLTNGTMRATPFYVPRALTLTRIGAEVTLAGDAGCTVRLGIYADDGTGYPGALVLDAGTIAGDSATVQEITISKALTAGTYWVVGVVQGVTVTQPTLRTVGTSIAGATVGMTAIPTAGQASFAYNQSGVTGALPGNFSTGVVPGSSAPRIFVKAA